MTVTAGGIVTAQSNGSIPAVSQISTLQAGQSLIGGTLNLVKNSASMTGTGWGSGTGLTATGGQTDPFGGTNAVQLATTATSGIYSNTGVAVTTGQVYNLCGYFKGNAGGEQQIMSVGNGASTTTVALTTSYQFISLPFTAGATTTVTAAVAPAVATQTTFVYGLNVTPTGTTCTSPGLPTGAAGVATSQQMTITPVLESNGTPSLSGCSLTSSIGGAGAGAFNSGTTGTCTVVITPGITAKNGFRCSATDLTTVADIILQTAFTTTTCTIAGTTVSADQITWQVEAF